MRHNNSLNVRLEGERNAKRRVQVPSSSWRGAAGTMPGMTEALKLLSEVEEMRPLIADARQCGKSLAIEVFQTRDGQPILIHFAKETV